MYYESIYTRCANGFDLLRNTEEHNSGGYKIHGLSRELLNNAEVDSQFLLSVSQKAIPM